MTPSAGINIVDYSEQSVETPARQLFKIESNCISSSQIQFRRDLVEPNR